MQFRHAAGARCAAVLVAITLQACSSSEYYAAGPGAGAASVGGAAAGAVSGGAVSSAAGRAASGSGGAGSSLGGGGNLAGGGYTGTAGATIGGASGGGNGGGGEAGGGNAGGAGAEDAASVIRIQVDYDTESEKYALGSVVRERSGTTALQVRAAKRDPLGSFIGTVVDPTTRKVLFQQTIGTGYYYRALTRAMSFRFPHVAAPFVFKMTAEDAATGLQQQVIEQTIDPTALSDLPTQRVETRPVKPALLSPKLVMPFYAEG